MSDLLIWTQSDIKSVSSSVLLGTLASTVVGNALTAYCVSFDLVAPACAIPKARSAAACIFAALWCLCCSSA